MSTSTDPEAEILFSVAPLSLLARYGSGGVDVLRRYATAMARGFPPDAPLANCLLLPAQQADRRVVYHWRALVAPRFRFGALDFLLLLLGHVGLRFEHRLIEFQTFHGASAAGVRKAKARRVWGQVLHGLAFFGLLAGLAVGLLTSVLTIFLVFQQPYPQSEVGQFGLVAGLAWLILAFSIVGFRLRKRVEVPSEIRFIARYPFYLHRVSEA